LQGRYRHDGPSGDKDRAEYVVPVKWLRTVPLEKAFRKKGFFANQNSACKLRDSFTLDELAKHFSIEG
jgi:hypothetical protein